MSDSLSTPILFLLFNRHDTTQLVFNEIRKAQPKQLFVAADGPRKNIPDDLVNCRKTREIIQQVDWECKVYTFFREENLGCKIAVSSAIDWFFSQVDEGIILEDDCLPDQSFFQFCQELLERYRNDERIMMITGSNYFITIKDMKESYYFSKFYSIWGWATWKRAWSFFDLNMSNWPIMQKQKTLSFFFAHPKIENFFALTANKAFYDDLDTWDIQWVITCIERGGLVICPKNNLISNIGIIGTHYTKADRFNLLPVKNIEMNNMIHPQVVFHNNKLDKKYFDEITKDPFWEKIIRKMITTGLMIRRKLIKEKLVIQ